jgi:hypothetical protein
VKITVLRKGCANIEFILAAAYAKRYVNILLNMKLKSIFEILFNVSLVSFILVTFACDSNNGATSIKQKEEIILGLYSTSESNLNKSKEILRVFERVLVTKDIKLIRPYEPILEKQYSKDVADLNQITELFSSSCRSSLAKISESATYYKDDNCSYTPVGFLASPEEEKQFKYFLQLSRYHGKFIECTIEASIEIMKKRQT